MSKISELAKTFKQTSRSEAESINQGLQADLAKLESDIKAALNDASMNLQKDIRESQRRWSMSLFKGWLIALIALCLLLLGLITANIWQGTDIVRGQKTLAILKDETGNIELSRCNAGTTEKPKMLVCAKIDPEFQDKKWGSGAEIYMILEQ